MFPTLAKLWAKLFTPTAKVRWKLLMVLTPYTLLGSVFGLILLTHGLGAFTNPMTISDLKRDPSLMIIGWPIHIILTIFSHNPNRLLQILLFRFGHILQANME